MAIFLKTLTLILTLTDDFGLVTNRKVLSQGILMSNMKALTITDQKTNKQTNGHTDKQKGPKLYAPIYLCGGIKIYTLGYKSLNHKLKWSYVSLCHNKEIFLNPLLHRYSF